MMADGGILEWVKIIVIMQAFFAVTITMVTYAMPADSLQYVTVFRDTADETNLYTMSSDIQANLEDQTEIPVVELGSLIFYSGNILIDLLLNFAFAIPEMIGLLINGITFLLNIDSFVFAYVQIFASVVISILYFIGIIQALISLRGQGRIV